MGNQSSRESFLVLEMLQARHYESEHNKTITTGNLKQFCFEIVENQSTNNAL